MSAVANVAINVDSRGAPAKLKQVADRSKQVEKAVQNMNGDLRRSQREFKGAGNAANQAASGFGKLGKAIAGIVTAAAAFQALKFTIVKTAELETQTRSLQVLTGSLESAQSIIKQLQDIGAVTPFTSTELIDTAKRLKAFGVETSKLVDTTKRLGDLAGATGAELNGIATAYGQIQAKGKLQTEELLQLQERGIDIASTLKEEYKLTGAEFTKALEKGQISAEAVEFALKKLTDTGGKYADGAIAQSDTLAGKFSTLQDNIGRFAQSIGQVLTPALNGVLDQINTLIAGFNQLFEIGGVERGLRQAGALDDASRQQIYNEATKEAERLLKIGRITKETFGQVRLNIFQESLKGLAFNEGLIKPTIRKLEAATLPPLTQGGGGNGGGGGAAGAKAAKDAQRAADAAAREAEQRRINLRNQDQLVEQLRAQIVLQNSFTDGDKIINQLLLDQLRIRQDIENRMEGADAAMKQRLAEEARLRNQLAMDVAAEPFVRAGMNMGEALAEGMGKAKEQTDLLQQSLQGAGDIIGNQLRGAIDGLIDGTADWNDILQSTLKQLGSFFLNFGLNQLAGPAGSGGILSFLGFGTRASGGSVSPGSTYLVGERGPELLTMGPSGGYITSNSASQAAMDRYSSGNARGGSISVNYNVTDINGMRFVTEDQFRAGVAQAAKQGADGGFNRTMSSLKNNRSTRSRIGV